MASPPALKLNGQNLMADNTLDILRQDALATRLKGVVGGARVLWPTKAVAQIRRYIWDLPERELIDATELKVSDQRSVIDVPASALILRAMDTSALAWQFQISNESPDLMNDSIKLVGWRFQNFAKNGPVLFCHDSGILPVGQSSMPWTTGSALMANVTFPAANISAVSDQVRGMIAAGVLRGASVGFVPGKFKFTSDPQRPMGIDFLDGHTLTEWSVCAVPANPSCLVVGPASGSKSAIRDSAAMTREQRVAEARALAAKARSSMRQSIADVATTREQRIAQAAEIRRLAYGVGK
jgi:phage head maturation protease